MTCALGDVASGDKIVHHIEVRAIKDLTEVLRKAHVEVGSDTPDPVSENNVDVAPITFGPIADLRVSKSVDDAAPAPGQKVSYTIGVRNLGPSTSTGAVLRDELPDGLDPIGVYAFPSSACDLVGQVVTCRVGQIVPGATFQALVQVRVRPNQFGARISNTVRVEPGPQTDRNSDNNRATSIIRVTSKPSQAARLRITTTASPSLMNVGSPVRVTAVVRNVSQIRANSPYICVTVPRELRYTASNGAYRKRRVCRLLDTLLPGDTATIVYTAVALRPGTGLPDGTASAGNAPSVRDATRVVVVPGTSPVTG